MNLWEDAIILLNMVTFEIQFMLHSQHLGVIIRLGRCNMEPS